MEKVSFLDSRNAEAIKMLDERQIDLARKLFLQNYRSKKTPMTMINLAAFLLDEHNFRGNYNSVLFYFRVHTGKKLLKRCLKNYELDKLTKYHLNCLLGTAETILRHYDKAVKYYMTVKKIKPTSIEALARLSWLSVLCRDYTNALSYLETLSQVFDLGSDIEKNQDIIFDDYDECTFVIFPYYRLLVYALSYIRPDEGKKLLDQMIDLTIGQEDPWFPAEDLILLCLHLGSCSYVERLLTLFFDKPWHGDVYVNAILFSLRNQRCQNMDIEPYKKRLIRLTSKISRFRYAFSRLEMKKDYECVIQKQFRPVLKECHFINCPIHCETEKNRLD